MKVHFESYGCSLIQGETEMMRQMALDKGWDLSEELEEADLLVISTCIVIQGTEARMSHRLKQLVRTGTPLIVYGCMPSAMADKVRHLAPKAILLTPDGLGTFRDLIERAGPGRTREQGRPAPVHANIPIANGCKGDCTYCITKVARGDLRSRPVHELKAHIGRELALGRKEIRLTAQDSAIYGIDIGSSLPEVLKEVCSMEGDFMVRVGMMNPNAMASIVGPLSNAYRHPKVFRFLHLPVQSGSDQVLDLMARGYTVKDYKRVLTDFRKDLHGLSLSIDIIAGFPGETEDDFRASCELLERVRPDVVNIKAFSPRPGTKAKRMGGRVDTKVVKARTKELTELKKGIVRGNLERLVGGSCKVLLTERPKPGTTMGRTPGYTPIVVKGEHPLGEFVTVEVTGTGHSYLKGERE